MLVGRPAYAGATASSVAAGSPSANALKDELSRVTTLDNRRRAVLSAIGVLAVVSAIAIIASTFFISVLQVRGN